MRLLKTAIKLFFILPIFGAIFAMPALAFDVDPSTGTYNVSQTRTINIIARPQSGETAVSIRISVTNMTITNYSAPTGWLTVIGMCGSGQFYTSTTVCVDMAKSSDITSGESLGTITVSYGSASTATLTRASGSAYSDGVSTRDVSGVAGSYTLAGITPTPTTLPDTANNTSVRKEQSIVLGGLLIAIGTIGLSTIIYFYKTEEKSIFRK